MKKLAGALAALGILILAGCSPPPANVTPDDISMLAQEIEALSPGVDRAEAERAAYLAYTYSLQLKEEYNVTDNPIIHNTKVNNGWRERGLCVHWADDLEARLDKENFRTLEMHRAIADGRQIRIDHSTAVISARGESFEQGIILDPWRYGGLLFWSPTLEDTRYDWEPRLQVLERKYQEKLDRQKGL